MAEETISLISFKKFSYITIEGQSESNYFFIIKKGRVERTMSLFIATNKKADTLKEGDFFGVISCMSNRPRNETVQALDDVVLIQIHRNNFETLIRRNKIIAMKILSFFSSQLRYFDSLLSTVIHSKPMQEDPAFLYDIGEYYKNLVKNPKKALYAYYAYLKNCANGMNKQKALEKIKELQQKEKIFKPITKGNNVLFKAEDIIFFEHEKGEALYFINEGKIQIFKIVKDQEIILAILKKGDVLGEISILDGKPRTASALALTDCSLMEITKDNFKIIQETYPKIVVKIINFLSERIWMIYRQISNALISDPKIKFYDFLYTQLIKNRIQIEENRSYTFEIEVQDILKHINMNDPSGLLMVHTILKEDDNLSLDANSFIFCKNIYKIEQGVNIVKRNLEIQNNIKKKKFVNIQIKL